MKGMRAKTTATPPKCTVGWPKGNIGYPHCDTPKGPDTTLVAPNLFQYCCPPTPLQMRDISGIQQRHLYREDVPHPIGVHSYYNVMWDGRVCRGDPLKKQAKKEEEECEKIRARLALPRKSKSLGESRAEAKASLTPEDLVQQEMMRYSQLAISSLINKEPTKYMQDLSDEIDVLDPCYKGRRLPPLRSFPIAPSRADNLSDVATQIYPNEFFDFEGQAQPLIEKLLGAVLDRAMFEVLEEEELRALLAQQHRHTQLLDNARNAITRWEEREKMLDKELERQRRQKELRENGEDEMVMLYNICAFSGTLTKDAINECINSLKKEGFLLSEARAIVELEFLPWLNDAITGEMKLQNVTRNLLNSVVTDVVNNREAQYAESMWRAVYDHNPLEKYKRDPPPTPGTSLAEDEDSSGEEEEEAQQEGQSGYLI